LSADAIVQSSSSGEEGDAFDDALSVLEGESPLLVAGFACSNGEVAALPPGWANASFAWSRSSLCRAASAYLPLGYWVR
jgi:hypothetical protein